MQKVALPSWDYTKPWCRSATCVRQVQSSKQRCATTIPSSHMASASVASFAYCGSKLFNKRSGARRTCWDGRHSQEMLMKSDTCILVDQDDTIIGSASKAEAHLCKAQPSSSHPTLPPLHRAFSVFLFDEEDRLLLQQRADDKITFPGAWTNTCCSHPLHGMQPPEVDDCENVLAGAVPGVKHAAVRKLQHELGIQPLDVPLQSFRFLTRLQYGAADACEPEPNVWGEHEIDYILFIKSTPTLKLNAAEVKDARYVSRSELQMMMRDESIKLWSPWFRIIAERFLNDWWDNLENILTGKVSHDPRIHRF
eukprot:TRINITY_DN80765_c0_g1_i1.p1 TRINITY_DN80765_c0_g1~~TRINITY_DN80765_c0_g1_i1.p1  ORF type:complete len:309 (-),score=58.55 TRINITY_DN80765_c0_g1_i1:36-962(-)